jgi:hypothetical protein
MARFGFRRPSEPAAELALAEEPQVQALASAPEPEPEPAPPARAAKPAKPSFVVTASFPDGDPQEVGGLATKAALNKQIGTFLSEGARFVQIAPAPPAES